jgi:transcriptional regulator with XRE-family HTH domain
MLTARSNGREKLMPHSRGSRPIHIQFTDQVLKRYASGEINSREVGQIYGVSANVALRELRRAGMVTTLSARKQLLSARRLGVNNLHEKIVKLYGRGLNLRQMATKMGLTPEGVRQILIRQGVYSRPPRVKRVLSGPDGQRVELKRLGARLRALRAEAGLSLPKLAARSGVSITTIYKLENCTQGTTWETLTKLARALAVGLHDLGVKQTEAS